jgi:hypothetical protein
MALLCFALGCLSFASLRDLSVEVLEMVDKIELAAATHKELRLTCEAISEQDAGLLPEIRSLLSTGLRRRGFVLVESDTALHVAVTLSRSLHGRILLAAIHDPSGDRIAIVSLTSLDFGSGEEPALLLKSRLLWESDKPILDVAVHQAAALLVLTAEEVLLLEKAEERWMEVKRAPVRMGERPSRDLRGRLHVSGSSVVAHLPGTICSGNLLGELVAHCEPSPASWPLLYRTGSVIFRGFPAASRNYFDGRLQTPGRVNVSIPPFLSVAALGDREEEEGWAVVGTDGRLRLYDAEFHWLGSIDRWAAEVTSLRPDCGPLVLAVRPEEGGDKLQAFRFQGARPRAEGAPLGLPGAVTALWSSADGESAVIVVRDPENGRYEAHELEVDCNR